MKTVLFIRGPVRLRETLALGFLGDQDAQVDLVPCVDEGGAHWQTGLINPERSTLLLDDPIPRPVRRACIFEALAQVEVEVVVAQAPGAAWKADAALSAELLYEGHRVIWAFIGPPMEALKERARNIASFARGACPGDKVRTVDVVDLQPGRAWSKLCQHLRIPV